MNRIRTITIGVLVLSLIGNGWFGFHIYKNSRVLEMQTASYDSFKISLKEAVKATDEVKSDKPNSPALATDAITANADLERAIGTIWGLRADFAKKGMDVFPIYVALQESENFRPSDPNFYNRETQTLINDNSTRLHDLESALSPTEFTNSNLHQLQKAVSSFYGKYGGYPSYSKLY